MSELPKGWECSNFGFIVSKLFTGLVRSASEQGADKKYKYLKMNNLSISGRFLFENITRVDATEIEVSKMSLEVGDFIFNTRNSVELVGKCGVFNETLNEPILFNNNLLKVRFFSVLPEYVSYWMNSPKGKESLRLITSATTSVAAIYQKKLMNIDVHLAPLTEQKRIVEKLDQVLAQVDTIKARLDGIPAILKRFRQSVLAAAVSGKLTEEWRGECDTNWDVGCLGDFIQKPSYGSSTKSSKTGQIPVLRMGNLQNGKLDWTDLVYTSDTNEIAKYNLQKGDVLFNRTNSPELGNMRISPSHEIIAF